MACVDTITSIVTRIMSTSCAGTVCTLRVWQKCGLYLAEETWIFIREPACLTKRPRPSRLLGPGINLWTQRWKASALSTELTGQLLMYPLVEIIVLIVKQDPRT